MLGRVLSHHGLAVRCEFPQYSVYAIYCGNRKPTATLRPPRPAAISRRNEPILNPDFRLHKVLNASSSKSRPLRMPLLRKVVAIPKHTPERSTRKSWLALMGLFPPRLLVNRRHPVKLNNAQEPSAKGAERNRPAGDITCSEAVVKANPEDAVGKTAKVRLNSTSTESR